MQTLKNNENIKQYNEKKSYTEPQLKELGKVNSFTKGSGAFPSFDGAIFQKPTS